jgi:hypothetical protein
LLALPFALASLAHRVELFHDELTLAFADLAEATTDVERRASQRLSVGEGNRQAEEPARMTEQALIQSTEFFDDAWILKTTVAFVGKEQASEKNRPQYCFMLHTASRVGADSTALLTLARTRTQTSARRSA